MNTAIMSISCRTSPIPSWHLPPRRNWTPSLPSPATSTYSEELLTKLILGQQSMDDWDTYMADLERLGLDQLIEINQARYDRAQGNA